jgi:uncharacterized protein
MKVVLDTMMWVSYSTHADGARARVIDRALRSRVRLFTSAYILDELVQVLGDRQDLPRSFVRRSARMIRRLAAVVDLPPAIRSYVSADPGDNPIIQTALTGKADCVVTADKAMLALGKVQDVEIISLDEFALRLPQKD